jgi:hypothetical protein
MNLLLLIIQGLLIDVCHKRLYGKRTILSYLPVATNYIYGKCACGKAGGYLIMVLGILSASTQETLTDGSQGITYTFGKTGQISSSIFSILSVLFLVLCIVNYFRKKENVNVSVSAENNIHFDIPIVDVSKTCDCGCNLDDGDKFCPNCGKKKEQY